MDEATRAALHEAQEALRLSADVIRQMIERGLVQGENAAAPNYIIMDGVLPKIGRARAHVDAVMNVTRSYRADRSTLL